MLFRQSFRTIFSWLFLTTINSGLAQAQVIPDGTLPTNVKTLGNMNEITGGKSVGNNLFHSFDKFSIPEGTEAIFKNALHIENIFTRVTGNEISLIEGLLKTSGRANLFLINPNGIVFGENARLDIGGSFLATTADSIEFEDGNTFAVKSNNPNISISITLPVGVNFNGGNGSITVNGSGNNIINDSIFLPTEFSERPSDMSVSDGQTLALVGNGVNFNGGIVTTEGGKIYITSVESGSVGISHSESGLTFIDDDVTKHQDINLNQQSLIDASGKKVGSVFASGQNINLSNASFILAQNQGNLSVGSIKVKASESLTLSGRSPDNEIASNIKSEVLKTAGGTGANIDISANRLRIQDSAKIQAMTYSDNPNGTGGQLNINTVESIEANNGSFSASVFGAGDANNNSLITSELRLTEGSFIASSTIGSGNGGEVNIKADSIDLTGANRDIRSNISASSFSPGSNPGNAGNVIVNTKKLTLREGGSLSSSSFGNGNSGNLTINASQIIKVSGQNPNFQGSNNIESTIRTAVQAASPSAQKTFGLPAVPTGNAGKVTINTPSLKVFDRGVIAVENQGTGNAGTLTINADNLNLDESGRITAAAESGIGGDILLNTANLNISNDSQITSAANGSENGGNITINTTNLNAKKNSNITASSFEGDGGNITIDANDSISLKDQNNITARSEFGNGGNITLNTDRLQLEKNSEISASAGGEGNGGNVTINTDIFTALNNSRVTANAVRGNGGEIEIDTTGYFVSDDFVVSATSEFGLDGTITINVDEEDLSKNFILPNYPLISLQEVLAKSCLTPTGRINNATRINSLGRGGLPISPTSGIDQAEDVPMQKVQIYSEKDWQPGEPMIQVEKLVTTPDGKRLGVAEVEIPKRCLN